MLPADERSWYVDHDHLCCPARKYCLICIRGVACRSCNFAVGFAQDDPERLRRIADNLEDALEFFMVRAVVAEVQRGVS